MRFGIICNTHPKLLLHSGSRVGGAGASSRCLRVKAGLRPGQVGSLSLGHVGRHATVHHTSEQLRVSICLSLRCGRKLERLDVAYVNKGRTCKLRPQNLTDGHLTRRRRCQPQRHCAALGTWHIVEKMAKNKPLRLLWCLLACGLVKKKHNFFSVVLTCQRQGRKQCSHGRDGSLCWVISYTITYSI